MQDEYADVFAHHEEEEVTDTNPAGYIVVHDPEYADVFAHHVVHDLYIVN